MVDAALSREGQVDIMLRFLQSVAVHVWDLERRQFVDVKDFVSRNFVQ
jgi:hypothetical protein